MEAMATYNKSHCLQCQTLQTNALISGVFETATHKPVCSLV